MPAEKWRPLLLAVLALVLAVVVYVEWPPQADAVRTTSTPKATGGRSRSASDALTAPDVHLKSLEEEHTKPEDVERDLFRFKTRPAPAPQSRPAVAIAPPPPVVPSGPPPPPPLPPIALKFIAVIETSNTQKIAVLSDGRGAPLYGREGDTVLGQYKILHIGVESIEMAYLDGRGRQTIRLSGS